MHIIFILVAALIGGATMEEPGAILGGVIGYLAAELFALKKRVALLEQRESTPEAGTSMEVLASEEVIFTPVDEYPLAESPDMVEAASSVNTRPEPIQMNNEVVIPDDQEEATCHALPSAPATWADRFFESIGRAGNSGSEVLRRFLTSGNLVLKMGIVILFLGVAFLIKYAAQQNLLPIEFRLAGAALGGLSLLGIGWRLRTRVAGYGLGLQGGGVGILYLVVYGAAKLYGLLPMSLSLALMVCLVVVSGVLAVLQDAKVLAVFGIIGGFLAPVLMSTGQGSHVMLFSYYGLLNAGILGIAWYKVWRELNLLGFLFTFGIGTFWGSQSYQPAFFSTTEPFLILFFVFYVAISVLFAHRQPVHLRGLIDGPLVLGLPLIVTGLQYALVRDFAYGMALSSFGLGFFYLLLATVLWRRLAEGMRLLCEAFLAMGVIFASMTIPLALDSNWTTAAWAMEGGAMVWVGVRQNRQLARIFGVLLQLGAAWTFLDGVYYPFGAIAFANSYFFGCLFVAGSALFSSFYMGHHLEKLRKWEHYLILPLLIWGMCWWYYGGLRESESHFQHIHSHNALLLFSCASTMLMAIVARWSNWRQLAIAQAVLLPVMGFSALAGLFLASYSTHLFAGWGSLAWTVAIYCQYRLLHRFDSLWPERLAGYWHAATLWLLLFIACYEAGWLLDVILELSRVWIIVVWGVIPGAVVFLLTRWGTRLKWPIAMWEKYYCGLGVCVPVLMLVLWSVFTLQEAGDPAPITYVPLINPLELVLFFVILVLLSWAVACKRGACYHPRFIPLPSLYWLIAALGFLWLNSGVARAVHFYCGIPYDFQLLYYSVVFQAAIAALWSFGALSVTVWAARAGNRQVWCCGAVLLGLVVVKLFLVDLSGTGTVARIVSFLVVGILMLVIGYFSPMPPAKKEESV